MEAVAGGFVGASLPQLEVMRSRLRLLLDVHMDQLQPEILRPGLDEVVIEQGAVAESSPRQSRTFGGGSESIRSTDAHSGRGESRGSPG